MDKKYFITVDNEQVEVNEETYKAYKRFEWREEKKASRSTRCIIGGKRCMKDCSQCRYMRQGEPLSLQQLEETIGYEPVYDTRKSVEDQVIQIIINEALYREIGKLPKEDQHYIRKLYLDDEPVTQQQLADDLGISQATVSKKHKKILEVLKARLTYEYCE